MIKVLDQFGGVVETHPGTTREDAQQILSQWANEGDTFSHEQLPDRSYSAVFICTPGGELSDIYALVTPD